MSNAHRLSNRPVSPRSQVEQEKRIRREIANSNERRRMQSINAGFNSLRTMLPKHDGEKLSKVSNALAQLSLPSSCDQLLCELTRPP